MKSQETVRQLVARGWGLGVCVTRACLQHETHKEDCGACEAHHESEKRYYRALYDLELPEAWCRCGEPLLSGTERLSGTCSCCRAELGDIA
jgi:hypothetical protein